jgi:hypothetical protein
VRQHHPNTRGQHAGRDIAGRLRRDDQLVVGIIQRGQRGQVFAQTLVVTLHRHDHRGGRQTLRPLGQPARHVMGAFALAAQRERRQ